MLQYLQDGLWAFFIYLKQNIEVGLDLATAFSIIGAAWVFINKYTKERKDKRNNEIWENFKKITDGISERKLEITEEVIKLKYGGKGTSATSEEVYDTVDRITFLSQTFGFYIMYETRVDIENLLEYYNVNQSKKEEILKIIDVSVLKIDNYGKQLAQIVRGFEKFQNEAKENIDLEILIDSIISITITKADQDPADKENIQFLASTLNELNHDLLSKIQRL